ncbi:hypothetical protein DFJ73DRAFT_92751 [Zopfochytrium polystomum]|nr:hypothetical protein DFJ73DRAFT_92751 [Zopfochytrium polystomum]
MSEEYAQIVAEQIGRMLWNGHRLFEDILWDYVSLHNAFPLAKLPKSEIDAIWNTFCTFEEGASTAIEPFRSYLYRLPQTDPRVMARALTSSFDRWLKKVLAGGKGSFEVFSAKPDVESHLHLWGHFVEYMKDTNNQDLPSLFRQLGLYSLPAIGESLWRTWYKFGLEFVTHSFMERNVDVVGSVQS